jgi:hypothetical protein
MNYICTILLFANLQFATIDTKEFYKVFSNGNLFEITKTIQNLQNSKQTPQSIAYIGALYMKQAGFENNPSKKLDYFRQGSKILDSEISSNPNNAEFRFIRIVIQENAPFFLGYNSQISDDTKILIQHFKQLDPFLQDYIKQYSHRSQAFSIKDFQ